MTTTNPNCSRRRLASIGSATIEACACGILHFTIGPVTMRIDRDSLAAIAHVVAIATYELADDIGANPVLRPAVLS